MNRNLKISLFTVFGFVFLMLVTSNSYGNIVFVSFIICFMLYVISKTFLGWKNGTERIWSSNKRENIDALNKNTKKDKVHLELAPLTKYERRLLFVFDIFSVVYWIVFAFISFYLLNPLMDLDGQSVFIFTFLFLLAVPISILLVMVMMSLGIKRFVKKIHINTRVWNSLFTVFLLPAVLTISGFFVLLPFTEILHTNELIYSFAVSNIFEPFIRGLVIVAILFLINKKRISRIFHKLSYFSA
jgi:hypothetical protein